jgi:hypothetical protein
MSFLETLINNLKREHYNEMMLLKNEIDDLNFEPSRAKRLFRLGFSENEDEAIFYPSRKELESLTHK